MQPVMSGLEGVVVAETALSDVDGAAGRLVIRGRRIEELAGHVGFEQALGLLASGELPQGGATQRTRALLAAARADAHERLPRLGDALDRDDAMAALLAALAHVPLDETDALSVAASASGALSTFAAAWWRRRQGLAPLPPSPDETHAGDYLRLVTGAAPDPARARALDAYLVTVCDHGLNASTFAARVVASTGSDAGSALCAALAALKGPLHGGAPGPVLELLERIGTPDRARAVLEHELASGRRIMGMGHRIYRVRDPRAEMLERAVSELEHGSAARERLALARAVEREAEALLAARHPERPLRANVEFYTAVLLDAVGLPSVLFSPTFAIARSGGWAAHVAEQRATGRLMRPSSRYVGA